MDSQETNTWGQGIGTTDGQVVINGTSNYIAHVAVAYVENGQLNIMTPKQLSATQLTIAIPITATEVGFTFSITGGLNDHQPNAGVFENWGKGVTFVSITLSGNLTTPVVTYADGDGMEYTVKLGSSTEGNRISKP